MSSNEAQVRSEAAATCERLAAEYEQRLALMGSELDRTRHELAVRTHTLAAELSRCGWGLRRQQLAGWLAVHAHAHASTGVGRKQRRVRLLLTAACVLC
jgi:hypothetical protein